MKRTIGLIFFLTAAATIVAAQGVALPSPKPVFKNGLWGYAEAGGRIVIAPQFDAAGEFENGVARVGMVDEELPEVNGSPNIKWGYINETGKVVVPMLYAALRPFAGGLAAAAIRLAGVKPSTLHTRDDESLRWGYVDRQGQVRIALQYLSASDFAEGLAAVNDGKSVVGNHETGLCDGPLNFGYIDPTGTMVIAPQYTFALNFVDGRARVGIGGFDYLGRCLCCNPRFRGTYGYVDRTGKFTADPNPTVPND